MNVITQWEIRSLKHVHNEGIYLGEAIYTSSEEQVKTSWERDGYAKANTESVQQPFALFKVTMERMDDLGANVAAKEKYRIETEEWDKLHGKINIEQLYQMVHEQMESKDIDCHESDLYLRKNDISTKLLRRYEFVENVTQFRDNSDNIEKTMWYEIPWGNLGYLRKWARREE